MLRTKSPTKTALALFLSLSIATAFYPAAAYADTDYEAAYNNAQAQAQAAYDDWQDAVADRDAKELAYDQAKADYNAAEAALEPVLQNIYKAHRLLDYKTRKAMDELAKQAWIKDHGNKGVAEYSSDNRSYTITPAECFYNTDSRMQEILTHAADNRSWIGPATTEKIINLYKSGKAWKDIPREAGINVRYGITMSASGTDDSGSLDDYTTRVYTSESYDRLMLSLQYFDEYNAIRKYCKNSKWFEGNETVLVSPYLMIQSAANVPMNFAHNVRAKSGSRQCGQNLGGTPWGEVNDLDKIPNHDGLLHDPCAGLFYSEWYGEEKEPGGHAYNFVIRYTHAGMATGHSMNPLVESTQSWFEQDFAITPDATGYTVSQYRDLINDYVSAELSAYNNAKDSYAQAQDAVAEKKEEKDDALYDYIVAKALASGKKTDYESAAAAEEAAWAAYQDWLNSNGGSSDDSVAPTDPTESDIGDDPAMLDEPETPAPAEQTGKETSSVSITTSDSNATEPQQSPSEEVKPSESEKPVIKLGTPSVRKITVNSKKKTAKISIKAAANANNYTVKIRRTYKLKDKKKVRAVTAWKTYNMKKAGTLTVKKLARKSIYQVKVTAINGTAKKTSSLKKFQIH